MRRGIGVAHIQQQRQTQQKMADLGAQITATRVGQIADELETLEQQLRSLAQRHKSEIKQDPVVRARFRQLADSLGVDLISSKKNVFAETLGLGDFYYGLAGKVVEACLRERKFCGAYVPLRRVVAVVQKSYDSAVDATAKNRTTISEEDVVASLKKLECLGEGYDVVTLGHVRYIQTTPDGTKSGDQAVLLNHVLQLQKEQIRTAQATEASVASTATRSSTAPSSSTASRPSQAPNRSAIGAAYVLGSAHPAAETSESDVKAAREVPFAARVVSATAPQLAKALGWPLHRCTAVLRRLVQEGSVWVDYPDGNVVSATSTHEQRSGKRDNVKAAGGFSAVEVKEVWRRGSGKHMKPTEDAKQEAAVYWFVSIGGGDTTTG